MKIVLLDTHAWAWALTGDSRLSPRATATITNAERVLVSPISFFEIGQKVRVGRWPEMAGWVDRLAEILEEQGGAVAPLEPRICLAASTMEWEHRDPFDRLIAASASHYRAPLVSADTIFDGVVPRVW